MGSAGKIERPKWPIQQYVVKMAENAFQCGDMNRRSIVAGIYGRWCNCTENTQKSKRVSGDKRKWCVPLECIISDDIMERKHTIRCSGVKSSGLSLKSAPGAKKACQIKVARDSFGFVRNRSGVHRSGGINKSCAESICECAEISIKPKKIS